MADFQFSYTYGELDFGFAEALNDYNVDTVDLPPLFADTPPALPRNPPPRRVAPPLPRNPPPPFPRLPSMPRPSRVARQTINFNVDNIVGDSVAQVYDRIKELKGQKVRIQTMGMNFDLELENTNHKLFNQLNSVFQISSDESAFTTYSNRTGEDIIPVSIIVLSNVSGSRTNQRFSEGINHCIFTSIMNWARKRSDDSKGKAQKKKWITCINHIGKYITKYKEGLPEKDIQEVCNKLQIDIDITLPLLDSNFIQCKSKKKALKKFSYINTRLNHVENYITRNDEVEEIKTEEEMNEIFDDIEGYKIWTRNADSYTSISTEQKKYMLKNDFIETVNEFENISGLSNVKIDDIQDVKLSKFVRQGVHYNNMINFIDENIFIDDNIQNIDMEKAYIQFKLCKGYVGFLGKITDFRKTNKIVGTGLYRITNIKFDGCSEKVRNHIERLGCYENMNVYPSPELQFLKKIGMTYDIIEGCWGVRIHFDIPKGMIKKDSKGVSYYGRYFGMCNRYAPVSKFWMKGTKKFFENLKSYSGVNKVVYDDYNAEGCIEYLKPRSKHLSHITAFITSYQRISVYEQLFELEPEEVLRIHTDGIYHTNENVNIKNVFRIQDKKMKNLKGCDRYISGIEDGLTELATGEYRTDYDKGLEDDFLVEYHKGAGGCGKTHRNLTDKGFIKTLYVAPSWKLASEKKEKYGVHVSVFARLLSDDPYQINNFMRYYNVIVIDECSMLTKNCIEKIINNYGMCKIIFCGDIGYQLPAITGDKLTEEYMKDLFFTKTYNNNYRIQDEKLLVLCNKVRKMIKDEEHYAIIIREIKRNLDDGHYINDVKDLYNIEDMILTPINARKDKYTKEFKGTFDKEKYYITNNNNYNYHTGDIVISEDAPKCGEVRHAFTVHCIQGITAEKKLFIDLYKIRSVEMIYTAISRARRMSQLYFIKASK